MTAWLYVGETTHRRRTPRPHAFRRRLFQLLLDVDRIGEDLRGLRLIREGRFGVFSFSGRDHGWRDDRPLRDWVEARLAGAGLAASAHRIRLLTFPRVLGFVFNPISLFFVEDEAGALEAVIYEVNNTFGQTHAYVAPAAGRGRQRQSADKALFVSPFFGPEGAYRFDVSPPGRRLRLTIVKTTGDGPDFAAVLRLERRRLGDARLLGLFVSMPLMTLTAFAAIHWQALRLVLKGIPLVTRPPGPAAGTSLATLHTRAAGVNGGMLKPTEGSADDDDRTDVRRVPARA
ncbi:MAG: DUF1365 domain-containing protein [Pseudomonadota bacterium]